MITQNQRTNQRAAAKAALKLQDWRGIQNKHCRGIQDTLNIKEKFCLGFHFSQFSCPGFHDKQQISLPLHCSFSESSEKANLKGTPPSIFWPSVKTGGNSISIRLQQIFHRRKLHQDSWMPFRLKIRTSSTLHSKPL